MIFKLRLFDLTEISKIGVIGMVRILKSKYVAKTQFLCY